MSCDLGHCLHTAGPAFPVQTDPSGNPTIIGAPQTCCRCGPARMVYAGIVEQGHGPYVTYATPPPSQRLILARAIPKNGV